MKNPNSDVTITDGSLDWSEGVNSDVVTTIQSELNPNGLKRTQVSWMNNATVRGGGITQRTGWLNNGAIPIVGQFMGQFMYEPEEGFPYLIMVIDGHVWKVDPTAPGTAVDLSVAFSVPGAPVVTVTGTVKVTLKNLTDPKHGFHKPAGTDPTIGSYESFTIPSIGATVDVKIATPYLGAIGATITLPGETLYGVPYPGGDYQIMASSGFTVTLSPGNPMVMPITDVCYFVQAEQFLVIQNGDMVTLPLIWDGAFLRQSLGITNGAVAPGTPGVNEIPPAGPMSYYMGRLWYAQGRTVSAGDIVRGASGTLAYNFNDAVLNVTENPLCVGGDGFTVPDSAGNIRGLAFASNLNTQLGQGSLYIGTRKEIYALTVPITRTDWIGATNNKGPLMTVALENNGWVNQRSIVAVNGDLFFQSLEPSIRSFTTSVRNFQQWGNVPISVNEDRILQFVDRSLMKYGSGIYFDNRLLQATVPFTCPVGVAHKAIVPLNFDTISTFERQLPPCWEGMWEGLSILELSVGDFGGRERAFASSWSDANQEIQIWELTKDFRWENDGNSRVSWYIEFPAFTWGSEFTLKKLVSGELWIDKLLGEVVFKMEYRPDGDPCWYPWNQWKFCTAKNSCETVHEPVCTYPADMRESYRQTVTLPVPPRACEAVMERPANVGYQFQCRLTILGWCRIRALLLHAEQVERKLYSNLVC